MFINNWNYYYLFFEFPIRRWKSLVLLFRSIDLQVHIKSASTPTHRPFADIGSPKPLAADVKAVLVAGSGHPLVEQVAKQFGEVSLTQGVCNSAELKRGFNKVIEVVY